MRRLVFTFAMIISLCPIYGQQTRTVPINLSYFGESLIHPGIELGYEHEIPYNLTISASIGTYIHQRNHIGLFISPTISWRHTSPSGYSIGFGMGLGYLHKWEHGGDTFQVDEYGHVSTKTKYGQPRFMPQVTLTPLGWDFREKYDLPLRLNADIVCFLEYPFNTFWLPHFALKLGATYYFSF